jgi:hypothetical protein
VVLLLLVSVLFIVPIDVYVPPEYLKNRMVRVDPLSLANVTLADQLPVANVPAPGASHTQPLPVGVVGMDVTVAGLPVCDQTSLILFEPLGVAVTLVSVPPVAVAILPALVRVASVILLP